MPRRERREPDYLITILCWVDEDGRPVEDVADRFQSGYMFRHEPTGLVYTETRSLASSGLSTFSLRNVIEFGFSTAEYKDILEFENEFNRNIQSEEELNELYPFEKDDPPAGP